MEEDFLRKTLYGVFGGLIALLVTAAGLVVGYIVAQDAPDTMAQSMAIAGAIALGIGVGLGFATFYVGSNLFGSNSTVE